MKAVITLEEIKQLIDIPLLVREIESGFVLYSDGQTIIPPVGFLKLEKPPGDVHIKYGYLVNDDYYVLKVASAFYENPTLSLPANNGVILLFSSRTGAIEYVLLDEGWLTDMRTAAAGAVAAKHLANEHNNTIGIVGTGVQARLQLELLAHVVECSNCLVWGRNLGKAEQMVEELSRKKSMIDWGIDIRATDDLDYLIENSRLIVTTTSASSPLIHAQQVRPGTHITAMGSDDHGKQELSSSLMGKADIIVADSISQCSDHGECKSAISDGYLHDESIVELGELIKNKDLGRKNESQITIADLTGVAVQDIQIANIIVRAHKKRTQTGSAK